MKKWPFKQWVNLAWDICPPISQIVLKNFKKISWIIKECPEEILIKLAIILKILSLAEALFKRVTSLEGAV
jgi:hypothetical protein